MNRLPNNALYRWITYFLIFTFFVTSIPLPPARAVDIKNLLANPSQADPFTTNVPNLREGLFELIHKKEMSIIDRHVQETGVS